MGFLSGVLNIDLSFDFLEATLGGGPSSWVDNFTGWNVIGGEIMFEVALTGYFGMPGATLEERIQNFVDIGAGTIIVNGKPNPAGGTDTMLYNAIDKTFVIIYDGIGDWRINEFPADPYAPPPPAPGTENAGYQGNVGTWGHYNDHFDLV